MITVKRLVEFFFLFHGACGLSAQTLVEWTNYNTYRNVNWMVDVDSAIWAGTREGIAVIHKYTLQTAYINQGNSGLPAGWISGLARDSTGTLWIATDCGLTRFSGNTWYTYHSQNSPLPYNGVNAVYYDTVHEAVIAGLADGDVIRLDTGGMTALAGPGGNKPQGSILSLVTDLDGIIWAGTQVNGLYRWDGTDWQCFNYNNSPILQTHITRLAVDSKNNLWIANMAKVIRYNGTSWTSYYFPYGFIKHLSIEANDTLWVSSWTGLYNLLGSSWQARPENSQLTSDDLNFHLLDGTHLWTGTYAMGVDRFKNNLVMNFPLAPGLAGSAIVGVGFQQPSNSCWTAFIPGHIGGISHLQNGTWENFTVQNSALNSVRMTSLTVSQDSMIWAGTKDQGLFLRNTNLFTNFNALNSDLHMDDVSCLATDQNQKVLIGFPDGTVQSFNGTDFVTIFTGGTASGKINGIFPDLTGTWILTDNAGLFYLDGFSQIQYSVTNSGIPSESITGMARDATGRYWITTAAGLAVFDGVSNWTVYDMSNSVLPEDSLTTVAIGVDSVLWVGSLHSGITRIQGNQWDVWDECNSSLTDNEVKIIRISPNGKIHIGTNAGLSVLTPVIVTGYGTEAGHSLVTVYPNPARECLTFHGRLPSDGPSVLRIYNLPGQLVWEKTISPAAEFRLSIGMPGTPVLKSGMYLYTIEGAFSAVSGKFIIE